MNPMMTPMMNPMMMGMGMMGMNPMMNPMAMGMGMAAMGAMANMGMGMNKRPLADDSDDSDDVPKKKQQTKGKAPAIPDHLILPGLKGTQEEVQDVEKELENIDEGSYVRVKYTHPQIGKTSYEGTLHEKFIAPSKHQSYLVLSNCRRYSSRDQLKETEASKRLMVAFVDAVTVSEPRAERSRSKSPRQLSPARS